MSEPSIQNPAAFNDPTQFMRGTDDSASGVQTSSKSEGMGLLAQVGANSIDEPIRKQALASAAPPTIPGPATLPERVVLGDTVDRLLPLTQPKAMLDIFTVMAAFYQSSVQLRALSQESAHASMTAQVASLKDSASDIRTSANRAMWAGIAMGIATIGAGMASGIGGMRGFSKGSADLNNATQMGYKGIADALNGVGKLAESILNNEAQGYQADSKIKEADATKAGGEREEMLKFRDNMAEHMSSTLSALQQVMQSREQTVSKIFA